jgi:type I restriction enzyme, S subunit
MSFEGWKDCLLGDVVTLKRGYDLPKKNRQKGRYPVIASNGISDYHNEFKVEGPGVTTGRSGTLGEVYYIDNNFWPLNTTLYVQDFHGNNRRFIYYLLQTLNLENYNAGSSVPTLNRNHIHTLPVKVPSVKEQEKIARILSSLDEKIELNNQINKNLEEMAQAIFKSWFVDFEPFQDGEFVESELGLIPKGWEVKRIEDIAEVTVGGDWGKDSEFEGATPVICLRGTDLQKLKEVGFSSDAPVRFVKKSSVDKRKLQENDILIGGSGLGPVGRSLPYIVDLQGIYNYPVIYSNFCKRLRTKNIYFALYLEHVLEKMHESGEIKNYVNGTSVPNLDIQGLLKHKILMPPQEIVRQFGDFKKVYYKNKFKTENIKLSILRDTLLPKLMSGEIRVPLENEGRHQDEQLQRV